MNTIKKLQAIAVKYKSAVHLPAWNEQTNQIKKMHNFYAKLSNSNVSETFQKFKTHRPSVILWNHTHIRRVLTTQQKLVADCTLCSHLNFDLKFKVYRANFVWIAIQKIIFQPFLKFCLKTQSKRIETKNDRIQRLTSRPPDDISLTLNKVNKKGKNSTLGTKFGKEQLFPL